MVNHERTTGVSTTHSNTASAVGTKCALNHKVGSEGHLALKRSDHLQVDVAHDCRRTSLLCRIENSFASKLFAKCTQSQLSMYDMKLARNHWLNAINLDCPENLLFLLMRLHTKTPSTHMASSSSHHSFGNI